MTTRPTPTEPTRVAAIDVGSNAIRYVVTEVSGGVYQEIESERVAVRLGTDVFSRDRRFRQETMDTVVAALLRVRRRLDDLAWDLAQDGVYTRRQPEAGELLIDLHRTLMADTSRTRGGADMWQVPRRKRAVRTQAGIDSSTGASSIASARSS